MVRGFEFRFLFVGRVCYCFFVVRWAGVGGVVIIMGVGGGCVICEGRGLYFLEEWRCRIVAAGSIVG